MVEPLCDVREISKFAYGFMASQVLFAALDVELFGHVAAGHRTMTALSQATGVARHRLETLVAVLERTDHGLVNSPAVQSYLVPGAPAYFEDYYRLQIGPRIHRDMIHVDAGLLGNREGLAHTRI